MCIVWMQSGCGSKETAPAPEAAAETNAQPAANAELPEIKIVGEIPQFDPENPEVAINTTLGTIRVRLYAKDVPNTVGNFLGYVNRNHYDGTIVHEVVPGFVAFAGAYTTRYEIKPTETPIANEADRGKPNKAYTLAMARAPDDSGSATSQFFFNLAENSSLNHRGTAPAEFGYCTFGEVVEGREIVDRIGKASVKASGAFTALPTDAIAIQSIRRVK